MATGGTIPSNRTQTVSFYNTTAVVEKDKNIYYVPRFSKTGATAGQQVRTAYLNAFEVVCPPSSAYSNITVSQWSPQDRTLRVKGNIDDFRAVTDEGECLNYFIISRTIEKTNGETVTTQVFYYAFFITGVSQAGGGSVQLTIEPDDFTNVFYLHNKHVLTQTNIDNDYEPFNEKMGNCYVKRQHYNRVKNPSFISTYRLSTQNVNNFPNNVGHTYSFDSMAVIGGEQEHYGNFVMTRQPAIDLDNNLTCIFRDEDTSRASAPVPTEFIIIKDLTDPTQISWLGRISNWTMISQEVTYDPDNMKIFMNQEESFKFKYQYRDDKYPISPYDGVFTMEERLAIENADYLEDLSSELRDKVIYTCIHYLVIETKSAEVCYPYRRGQSGSTTQIFGTLDCGELLNHSLNRPNPIVCYPYIESPEQFKKFNLEESIRFLSKIVYEGGQTFTQSVGLPSYKNGLARNVMRNIQHEGIADYIQSVYVVNNIGFPKSLFSINATIYANKYDVYYSVTYPGPYTGDFTVRTIDSKGFYASGIRSSMDSVYGGPFLETVSNGQVTSLLFYDVGILASGVENIDYLIPLNILGDIPSSLKTNYYDPVLETEPYKFYSVSILSNYELVFNKNRYYSTGEVVLKQYYSVNGSVKISYIPYYEVDDIVTPYFNEGLVFTLASTLPIVSDSYYSYYNQNKAQMKNQYAVADKNFQYDFAQQSAISAPASILQGAIKKGNIGASSELVGQSANIINKLIDYSQQLDIIDMTRKAKLADVGNAPDTLKQAGSDLIYDLKTRENFLFLNHYTIDKLSYDSIAKLLERVGYTVNLYSVMNIINRVGWNYIELNGFDWKPTVEIMTSQEEKIRQIFLNGVTLLHDKTYLTTGHNYETILE